MSIESFRFRSEGELVVLQVKQMPDRGAYEWEREGTWRDAKVTDLIDIADLIRNKGAIWNRPNVRFGQTAPIDFDSQQT